MRWRITLNPDVHVGVVEATSETAALTLGLAVAVELWPDVILSDLSAELIEFAMPLNRVVTIPDG